LKTEVFALSRHLNDSTGHEVIPQAILDKAPSAELAPNQKDSDSLPPYEVLDEILRHDIEGLDRLPHGERGRCEAAMAHLLSTPDGLQTVQRVRQLIARSEYKRRQAPPIIRLRPRAFGAGRQMPIAAVHGR
ncbi:MAG: NAD+ synthase, partial [Aquincola sp.]|nr:NAD+ synthase [Aquincola sp.]